MGYLLVGCNALIAEDRLGRIKASGQENGVD
jgi:hypothetical protein